MQNFAKTFVSNMANGDIFYSRLSFGTIQQQFFGIFQFVKGRDYFKPDFSQNPILGSNPIPTENYSGYLGS